MNYSTELLNNRVPVGKPLCGIQINIADENGKFVEETLGEIIVSGESVASGYWDPNDKRIRRFQSEFINTGDLGFKIFDNSYFLLGRSNQLVKIHGYRINLEELEMEVNKIEGVKNSVIMKHVFKGNKEEINIFYVLEDKVIILPSDIEKRLVSLLPVKRININCYQIAIIPRLPGGKINRDALVYSRFQTGQLALGTKSIDDIGMELEFANEIEPLLADIWCKVLEISHVSPEDDFFEVGGDSISAFILVNNICSLFGVEISFMELFSIDSLREMANLIISKL